MNTDSLNAEREHLANLLEALQRCAHFLHASASKVAWPLDGATLQRRQKDVELFESLAAFNERFAKLQDTLGAAMRHCALLMGENTTSFLKVLTLFEKLGVIDSVDAWQLCRTARNLAAHDYLRMATHAKIFATPLTQAEAERNAQALIDQAPPSASSPVSALKSRPY